MCKILLKKFNDMNQLDKNLILVNEYDLLNFTYQNLLKNKVKYINEIISVSDVNSVKGFIEQKKYKMIICDYETITDKFLEWLRDFKISIIITSAFYNRLDLHRIRNINKNIVGIFKTPSNPQSIVDCVSMNLKY